MYSPYCNVSPEDVSPSSGSLLIWSIILQYYGTLDEIRLITCLVKKKKAKIWSILMSSQDTTLSLYPMMSSYGDPVSAYSNIFQ